MAKTIVEVSKEVQDAFSKDLEVLCEQYGVKLMPIMYIVKEVEIPDDIANIQDEAPAE